MTIQGGNRRCDGRHAFRLVAEDLQHANQRIARSAIVFHDENPPTTSILVRHTAGFAALCQKSILGDGYRVPSLTGIGLGQVINPNGIAQSGRLPPRSKGCQG